MLWSLHVLMRTLRVELLFLKHERNIIDCLHEIMVEPSKGNK